MNKMKLSWQDIFTNENFRKVDIPTNIVYGVPAGGMIIAGFLKKAIITHDINEANVILDDIIDSGKTKEKYTSKYPCKQFVGIVNKIDNPDLQNIWIEFPWETEHPGGGHSIEDNITRIIEYLGDSPKRPGLIDTPKRVIKMYKEIFRGYDKSQKPKVQIFKNGNDGLTYDQMIIDEGTYFSHCEHHMVPFFGKYWFAYIPGKNSNIIGLSKVSRIIDWHAGRLQIQERLVHDIVEDLWQIISENAEPPIGMGIVMVGEHLCKTMRGVKKKGKMTTIKLKGNFLDSPAVKQEFLQRCV